ncbi:FMN-binding glutamate synthase family protein [Wenzhouxiangella sediminis]|uniref:FMN-binding glutamate synthase family protein n=1 Tax=Wenzhouxiangella sediminis TaxID=1792836 RepID=A0A3E1K624_9GAMM|nr:FMN-binding glutamate synthase family protein [Wenzhouxiangella sediminis]RFF29472.1 FMN-binding glutamate synthase family protein [Wenzhouxiangella sediminis]
MARQYTFVILLIAFAVIGLVGLLWPPVWWSLLVIAPLLALGIRDAMQTRHTVLRNFPIIGHFRYLIEHIRPEIQQYLVESNLDAYPVEREYRSLIYQRAKGDLETRPFGTHRDVYRPGYEWAAHCTVPAPQLDEEPRIDIGGKDCKQPYSSSLLNISAMSFGSLSSNAILALNGGARAGGFAHNTGEGGVSRYHLEHGGDLIWQIGSGYFGCRTPEGRFNPERFEEVAAGESIRMIEVKLSQGAKPGAGGILPAPKVNREIAEAREVAVGEACISPPAHSAFSTPVELMEFIGKLRELSGGKPVGMKFCMGRISDFLAICRAMLDTGIRPDFITVDGGEGGTGAAPLEFSNSLGMPKRDALVVVHDILTGTNLRDDIRIICSGKILSAFHMIRSFALGADGCNSARAMMFALGCIQSLRCNSNTCPTGVTTQDPALRRGLVVEEKIPRVQRYHQRTIEALIKMLSAMGLNHPDEVMPHHIYRRSGDLKVASFAELYEFLEPGQLLDEGNGHGLFSEAWKSARSDRWT